MIQRLVPSEFRRDAYFLKTKGSPVRVACPGTVTVYLRRRASRIDVVGIDR